MRYDLYEEVLQERVIVSARGVGAEFENTERRKTFGWQSSTVAPSPGLEGTDLKDECSANFKKDLKTKIIEWTCCPRPQDCPGYHPLWLRRDKFKMWQATKQRTQKMIWVYKLEINIKHFHCAISEQKKKSAFSSNFCFLFDVKSERCVNF